MPTPSPPSPLKENVPFSGDGGDGVGIPPRNVSLTVSPTPSGPLRGGPCPGGATLGEDTSLVFPACDTAFGFIHALPADRSGGRYQNGIPPGESSSLSSQWVPLLGFIYDGDSWMEDREWGGLVPGYHTRFPLFAKKDEVDTMEASHPVGVPGLIWCHPLDSS